MPFFAKFRFGFTLIELLVSMAIIGILTAIIITGQVQQKNISIARRTAEQVVNDIQNMQNNALSGQTISGVRPQGFGASFNLASQTTYVTFGDQCSPAPCTADSLYTSGEAIQTVSLDPVMKIQRLCTNATTCIGTGLLARLDLSYQVPGVKLTITQTLSSGGAVSQAATAQIVVANTKLNVCYAVSIDAASGTVSNRQLAQC